jgi:hypothetical protein
VPARRRKRQRLGVSTAPADRLVAEHPDHVWALDYQFDQTTDRRILKWSTSSTSGPATPWPSSWTAGSMPTPPLMFSTSWSPTAAGHRDAWVHDVSSQLDDRLDRQVRRAYRCWLHARSGRRSGNSFL